MKANRTVEKVFEMPPGITVFVVSTFVEKSSNVKDSYKMTKVSIITKQKLATQAYLSCLSSFAKLIGRIKTV